MGQKESSGVSNCFQSIFTSGRIDRERILWRIFIESRCFDVANIWYSCRCHKIVFSDLILWAAIEKLSEFPADFFVFQGKLDCRFQITEFAATIIANSIEFISEYRFASQEGFYGIRQLQFAATAGPEFAQMGEYSRIENVSANDTQIGRRIFRCRFSTI